METIKKNKNPILYLNYIFENEEPDFHQILIGNDEYSIKEVNHKELEIKFNEIEKELGSKTLDLTLKNSYFEEAYNFELISGVNTGILFPGFGYTRDIIFPEMGDYKVKIIHLKTKEIREFSIKNRLLLINFNKSYALYINGLHISREIINSCPQGELSSSQISVVDLEKRIFISKAISHQQFDLFFKAYKSLKGEAKYFLESIDKVLNKNKINYEDYNELFFNEELIRTIIYKFNLPKNILKNEYNEKRIF